jgi:outer membrane protein TolC
VLFATELALNQARGALATDTIALNKALGGEWTANPELRTLPTP